MIEVRGGIVVSQSSTPTVVTIAVTVLADQLTGSALHGLGFTPYPGRPNPDNLAGNNSMASANATSIIVTLLDAQAMDINFRVPCSAI